ncbi:RHS repeat-associated core domain-containing protein [Flaviaesturariibacter amylovorans]|uniref:RHS repeat-associated core domain-containing protein n=1 Tax=Flaviaesturariibacter amylovorans TaxID=1084520 RepID=A0ABP8GBQ0_9BACT
MEYKRNGVAAKPGIDNLIYKYPQVLDLATNKAKLVSNRLRYVYDAVGANDYNITPVGHSTEDIDSQTPETDANVVRAEVKTAQPATDNYDYDRIGNLIRDRQSKLDHIYWTVYGKIDRIVKAPALNTEIAYDYDAAGNRIGKKVTVNGLSTYTFYVRDAQGNTLGIYTKTGNQPVQWGEQMLYGSSRLGTIHLNVPVPAAPMVPVGTATLHDGFEYVRKTYELSNHLGNVLATVSDQKRGVDPGADGTSDYYIADVATANDYYPFGMQMPGRKFAVESGYRYGFNAKEDDVETGLQDYGMRIYNPALGKFLSLDPLSKKFPWWTPYAFAGNMPIAAIDLDGLEPFVTNTSTLTLPRIFLPRVALPRISIPKPTMPLHPGEVTLPLPGASVPSGITVGQPKVEMSESSPIDWVNNVPASPEFLGEDWKDITDPRKEASDNDGRDYENVKTGEKITYDPAKKDPKSKDGWDRINHWHRHNPNRTGTKDYYLDKYGRPTSKGSDPSHIEAPKSLILEPIIIKPERKGFFRRSLDGIKKWWKETNQRMARENEVWI